MNIAIPLKILKEKLALNAVIKINTFSEPKKPVRQLVMRIRKVTSLDRWEMSDTEHAWFHCRLLIPSSLLPIHDCCDGFSVTDLHVFLASICT